MKLYLTFLLFMLLCNHTFAASDFENILACINKAKEKADVILNKAPKNYESHWIGGDIITWSNATCKVSGKQVKELIVNDKAVIYNSDLGNTSGDTRNIKTCIITAQNYTGIILNEIPKNYDSNWLSSDVAVWDNAICEVSSESVYNLTLNDRVVVYKGFSGLEAYKLQEKMVYVTEQAVDLLKNRIEDLQQVKKYRNEIQSLENKKNKIRNEYRNKKEKAFLKSEQNKLSSLEYDAIHDINMLIYKSEEEVEKIPEVKKYRKKIIILHERKNKSEEYLKKPSPDLKEVSLFIKDGVNKFLQKKGDKFDYYSSFQVAEGLDDELIEIESGLRQLK